MITKEVVEEVVRKINNGATKVEAYKESGFNPTTIRAAAKRFGIELPSSRIRRSKAKVCDLLMKHKTQIEQGELSLRKFGKMYRYAQPYLSTVCKELGIKPALYFYGRKKGLTDRTIDMCQQVVYHIMENGGYVSHAIKALGLSVFPQTVRNWAKDNGIDLSIYRNAHQQYGLWRTLPSPVERAYTCDFMVKAVCEGCGTVHKVALTNLRSGMSSSCKKCAAAAKRSFWVTCPETQTRFRSIMAWVKSIDKLRQYQTIRKQIIKDGTYVYDGLTYVLKEKI